MVDDRGVDERADDTVRELEDGGAGVELAGTRVVVTGSMGTTHSPCMFSCVPSGQRHSNDPPILTHNCGVLQIC